MYYIGIDVGSTYTKVCILDSNYAMIDLYSYSTPIGQKDYFENVMSELKKKYPELQIVSCGYGKSNVMAVKAISELTALACGSNFICPEVNTILDIGGQDTKIIVHEEGRLKEFFVNDKCAAGCGMFLKNTLNMLGKKFEEIDITESEEPEVKLSSTCAVFAQSEIVGLLAKDCEPDEIIRAVIWQILQQAKALLLKVECQDLILSGGLTNIKGIETYAEMIFKRKIIIPEYSSYMSALGCALQRK